MRRFLVIIYSVLAERNDGLSTSVTICLAFL